MRNGLGRASFIRTTFTWFIHSGSRRGERLTLCRRCTTNELTNPCVLYIGLFFSVSVAIRSTHSHVEQQIRSSVGCGRGYFFSDPFRSFSFVSVGSTSSSFGSLSYSRNGFADAVGGGQPSSSSLLLSFLFSPWRGFFFNFFPHRLSE